MTKEKILGWVNVLFIAILVIGYVLMVFAPPLAGIFLVIGIPGAMAWSLIIRPYLLKK